MEGNTKKKVAENFGVTWATIRNKIEPVWDKFKEDGDFPLRRAKANFIYKRQLKLLYEHLGEGSVISKEQFAKQYGVSWRVLKSDFEELIPLMIANTPYSDNDNILFPKTVEFIYKHYGKP